MAPQIVPPNAADLASRLTGSMVVSAAALSPKDADGIFLKCGYAPAWIIGERPLAWVREGAGDGVLVTTHALAICESDMRRVVSYETLEALEVEKGFARSTLVFRVSGQTFRYKNFNTGKVLAPFLTELLETPPDQRTPRSGPLARGSEVDPTGADGARRAMPQSEPRLEAILRLIEALHRKGRLDQGAALAAVARVRLLERTMFGGRGKLADYWLTVLSPDDLRVVLGQMWGMPTPAPENPDTLRFNVSGIGGDVAKAVAAKAAASAMAAVVGFGVAPAGQKSIKFIEAEISDFSTATGIALRATRTSAMAPMHFVAPSELQAILRGLIATEARTLLRRLLYGDEAPLSALADKSQQEVQATVDGIANLDVSAFFEGGVGVRAAANPSYKPPAPAVAPPVRAASRGAELPAWESRHRSIGTLQLLSGLANILVMWFVMFWVYAIFGFILDSNFRFITNDIAIIALLPGMLVLLGMVEVVVGILGLVSRRRVRMLQVGVAVLEIMSIPIGGCVAAGVGLASLAMWRSAERLYADREADSLTDESEA